MKLSELLSDYEEVDAEAGDDLARIASLAKEYGRAGSVTVTFKVDKAKNRVQVSVAHKTKEPAPDAEASMWHVGPAGLTKEDQFQQALPLDRPTDRKD